MFSARVSACAILLVLTQPALAQVHHDATRLPGGPPVSQTVGPILQTSPTVSGPSQAQRDRVRPEADNVRINEGVNEARVQTDHRTDAAHTALGTSGPTQAQRDAARREADNARINEGIDEAREHAAQRTNAANMALATGVVSGASQIGAGAFAQSPGQQSHDIEAVIQQTMRQTAQDANADMRDGMSAVQRENQRRRALRAHAECLRNAANANQCPCPSGTQGVNGQCVAAGN